MRLCPCFWPPRAQTDAWDTWVAAARARMAPSPDVATGMLFVGRDSKECRALLKGIAAGLGNSEKLGRLVLLERPLGETRPPVVTVVNN